MAITKTQLQAVTHDLVLASIANGVFLSSAGFRKFYKDRDKLDGGVKISHPVIISGEEDDTTGGWYFGAEELTDAEKEDLTLAEVNWKQVYETVLISQADINMNNGKSQIMRLLNSKVKIAEKRLKTRLAKGVFNDGTVPKAFIGLQKITAATGDYAGLAVGDIVDEAGNDAWKAYVNDISEVESGALTEKHMQVTLGRATEDDDRPDWAVMRQNVFDEIWSLLKEHQRIMADDSTFSGAGHDQRKVLIYNGIPHFIDSHAVAQSIDYINSEYTKLAVHVNEDLKAQKFSQLESVNAVKERMLLMGNLLCWNRNKNSRLTGIAVAA